MTLRPYQIQLIGRVRHALRGHRAVLLQSVTGSGKTVIAADITHRAVERQHRVLFNAHRDFLLSQTSGAFTEAGIPHSFIAAGRDYDPDAPVHIASVQTLARRIDGLEPTWDLIIWDEAHHLSAASYTRIYEWAPDAHHIGLSATPARLDGRGLDKYFGALVQGPSAASLISQGFLSPYRAFAPSAPDLTGVHTVAGDYNTRELEEVMSGQALMGNIVDHYISRAHGKRAVYFGVSVLHSQRLAGAFLGAGVEATHLDATSSLEERVEAAVALARGEIQVITNCDLFGEGYDLAAQAQLPVTVDCVGLARPTQSLCLHLQQVGRCLRPKADGSAAIILDHAGNLLRHGLPDEPRQWTLAGREKGKRKAEPDVNVKQCKECFGVFTPGPTHCPHCGAAVEVTPREIEHVPGELAEITQQRIESLREEARTRDAQRNAHSYAALVALGRARGYRSPEGWARHVVEAREKRHARV